MRETIPAPEEQHINTLSSLAIRSVNVLMDELVLAPADHQEKIGRAFRDFSDAMTGIKQLVEKLTQQAKECEEK